MGVARDHLRGKSSRSWLTLDSISTRNAGEISSLNITSAVKVVSLLLALDSNKTVSDGKLSDLGHHLNGNLPFTRVNV